MGSEPRVFGFSQSDWVRPGAFTEEHLGALTPALLIYGARDHIAEAKYGRALAAALRARGTGVAYLEIPWADHAFDVVFNGPSSQLSLYYIERFIAWAVSTSAADLSPQPSSRSCWHG